MTCQWAQHDSGLPEGGDSSVLHLHTTMVFRWQALRANLHVWRHIGASKQVLSWIRSGVKVEWARGLRPRPFQLQSAPLTEAQTRYWLEVCEPAYLANGAIKVIDKADAKYVSRAFFVDKLNPTGGPVQEWRLVVDATPTNAFSVVRPFKHESVHSLAAASTLGCQFIKFDLADAYHHLALFEPDQQFFQFSLAGKFYQCTALPFGWNGSPYHFAKLMRVVIKYVRSSAGSKGRLKGMHILHLLNYLDDFVCSATTHRAARYAATCFRKLLPALGLTFKDSKCIWQPTPRMEVLGTIVDSNKGTFELPDRRRKAIMATASHLIKHACVHRRWVPKKLLAKFTGQAVSASVAVPYARFHLMHCHDLFKGTPDWTAGARVRLSHAAIRELKWWARAGSYDAHNPWQVQPFSAVLTTDSSDYGWGGLLERATESWQAQGYWDRVYSAQHITVKELAAVRMALMSFVGIVQGCVVRVRCDASAAVGALVNHCTKSKAMRAELIQLHEWLMHNNVSLVAVHIPGILNTVADGLSRLLDYEDWQLQPRVFEFIQQWAGMTFTCDRFASYQNNLCQVFWSQFHQPGAEGVDCFTAPLQNWVQHVNWCNPPWSRLFDLALLFRDQPSVHGAVVAPHWPGQPWFPIFMQRCFRWLVISRHNGMFKSGLQPGPGAAPAPTWDVIVFVM